MSDEPDTLLEFPCDFDIKAFGRQGVDFEQTVFRLVRAHAPELEENDLRARVSSGGKYLSVTVSIRARSKAQLDSIYEALTDSDAVLMSL
ncbi:MAG: transcriptional regulator [Xanthomonadales bacterium]|nr:transcriptional regulator [Xanthomonadales bacterium]|tara:strand:- start:226 stop:495 length:270 start_codon:yes stop_codon:yes gene_type:complete